MRHFKIPAFCLTVLLALAPLDTAFAQLAGTGDFHIAWEVKSRFRLFRHEADFLRMAAAARGDGVLAAERRLARDTDGLGWAKDVVAELCLDPSGNLLETCDRDGERESYLAPRDYPVGVTISGAVPEGLDCLWRFDDGETSPRQSTAPCDREVKLRVRAGRTTITTVDIPLGDGTAQRVTADIAVRDILIAGLGDSIAAGEGNPDRAIKLEGGFCFRRFGAGSQYYRPSRAGYADDRSCENGPASPVAGVNWAKHGARWMNPACHRSLYSYQVRTALALAIEHPHLAVTLLPMQGSHQGPQLTELGRRRSRATLDADHPGTVVGALSGKHPGVDSCSGAGQRQQRHGKVRVLDRERQGGAHLIAVERAVTRRIHPAGAMLCPIHSGNRTGRSVFA